MTPAYPAGPDGGFGYYPDNVTLAPEFTGA